jgi:hypothetical protein
MAARWDRLPDNVKVADPPKRRRAPAARGRWYCTGPRGCGHVIEGTWASAERHADTHGGARLEGYAIPPTAPPL